MCVCVTQLAAPVPSDGSDHFSHFMLKKDICENIRRKLQLFGINKHKCTHTHTLTHTHTHTNTLPTHHLLKVDQFSVKRLAALVQERQI